jgi:hypothetical protein
MDYEVIERDSQAVELILVGRSRTIHVERNAAHHPLFSTFQYDHEENVAQSR